MTNQETDQEKVPHPSLPLESSAKDERAPSVAREAGKQFDIDIYRAWCKSCGICAAFCPKQCLQLDEEGAPVVVDTDRCTGCGWCELHCPDFAISVHLRKATQAKQAQED
jgi:2-oxoglutarate ferredoxin oxidoreductase subunit delta